MHSRGCQPKPKPLYIGDFGRFYLVKIKIRGTADFLKRIVVRSSKSYAIRKKIGLKRSVEHSQDPRRSNVVERLLLSRRRLERDPVTRYSPGNGRHLSWHPREFGSSEYMRTVVYGVRRTDLGVNSASYLILMVVAVFASYIPAHRASRLDPAKTLRSC